MRSAWEASPRQGLAWLVTANGGQWDVSEEAVRQRRARENWQKRGTLGSVVEKAMLDADRGRAPIDPELGSLELGVGKTGANSASGDPSADPELGSSETTEKSAVELRSELVQQHRNEWRANRALLYRAMRLAKVATGMDAARAAKITAETLALIQAGERKAYGLDAAQADVKSLSDEDLERMAAGRMPA
jgi:hypothetical protein